MNIGLRIWALLKLRPFPWLVRIIHWWADRLEPFGTDRGGMQVTVIGSTKGILRRRRWTLLAASGDGPYIPGVVARALLRNPGPAAPGARPDLGETPLSEVEAAFRDLDVDSRLSDDVFRPLFASVLGEAWDSLPAEIQALHSIVDREVFCGEATVEGGTSVAARIVSAVFNFPSDGDAVPVTVTMTRTDRGETWVRDFGGKVFRSHLSETGRTGRIWERFGLFRFELEVPVVPGEGLRLPVSGGRFLGLPLPRFLLPISDAREYVEDGWFRFDVDIRAPLGLGRIARYRGRLVRREG